MKKKDYSKHILTLSVVLIIVTVLAVIILKNETMRITAFVIVIFIVGAISSANEKKTKETKIPIEVYAKYNACLQEMFLISREICELCSLATPYSDWNIIPHDGKKVITENDFVVFRFEMPIKPKTQVDCQKIRRQFQVAINRRYCGGFSTIKTKNGKPICVGQVFHDGDILEIQILEP